MTLFFFFFWIVVSIVVFFWFALWVLLRLRFQVVPEEERLIIYRMGAFERVAGPGLVWLTRLHTIHHTIDVRDRPRNVRVDGLFMRGIPFGYTLNFWYQVDLSAAANRSQDDSVTLPHLAQFSNEERDKLVHAKVRDALVRSIARVDQEYKPAGKEFFYNLLPIIPGLPDNEKLLAYTRAELQNTLPLVGAMFNSDHPLSISGFTISQKLADNFDLNRSVQMLKEQFPHLPQDMLLQAVTAINEIDMAHKRITVHSEGAASASIDEGNDGEPRARIYTSVRSTKNSSGSAKATDEKIEPAARLSKEDLSVLKRVR